MNNLLIFYLTSNDRPFVFERFLDELIKLKNKNIIKLLIVNSNSDFSFYEERLKKTDILFEIVEVNCPQSNYLPKVTYAIEHAKLNGYKYILKYDSDVLIPSYTLEYMIENLDKLNNESALTISPTLTTGIPSVEYFIDDFLSDEESILVRNEFKKCVFHIQEGIMDYTPLNSQTIQNSGEWNYNEYYKLLNSYINNLPEIGNNRTINNYCKFYKGIHPIRHGFGNELINNLIIKNKERFFSDKKCSLFEDDKPYLCDMCFIISTHNYDKLINHENLIIDGCDEVPLNRYSWKYNLKNLIVKSGYAIHITYNWRWFLNQIDGGSNIEKPNISMNEYEQNFINKLYDTN